MDTGPGWERAREEFLALVDAPAEARARELERLEAEDPRLASWVRDLLRHDAPTDPRGGGDGGTPRSFGPYEVVRPIGRGGMGEVFVARRADGEYESEVAVKLLRGGAANRELVQRFLRERQMLARLDHEYVARLLDGGTTEAGEPYLVMEYVEGEPADVFAARLDVRARLELFLRIGQAVQHAHERGFVHRDLKPGNILVRPDGTPRLLDFGIARLDGETAAETTDEPLTRTGHRLFTPEYASPEQVRGEVATVQSDVFALGVILYQLLCGARPWPSGVSLHELERTICEADPVPPSRRVPGTARARLAGDLDAIALQCLAKRPERRYGSVAELCDDVGRHLQGLPIRARRTGVVGRALRYARRRPAVPVTAALIALSLLAVGFAWDAERRGERRREELAAAVSDHVEDARRRWVDGELEAAKAELDAARVALRELPDEPGLAAEVLAQAAVFANLEDDWERGLDLVERAEAQLARVAEPAPRTVATLLSTRAYALHRVAPGERSRAAAAAALEHARANLEPGDALRVDALADWSDEQRRAGDADGALATLAEAVEEARLRDPRGETLSRLLNERAVALAGVGRYAESVEHYREALGILAWHRGDGHAAVAKVRLNLGTTLFRQGALEEARAEHERSLAAFRMLGDEVLVASNQHFLGRIHCALGELDAAEAAAGEALAIRARHDLGIHVDRTRCLLGIVLARAGRAEEARALLAPVLADPAPGTFLPDMEADGRHELGALLADAGEPAAARPQLEAALAWKRAHLGPDHADCRDLERRLDAAR